MLHALNHPLISEELTLLRDPGCPTPEFRQRIRRIASLMTPDMTPDFETSVVACTTPLEITSGLNERGYYILPGLGDAGDRLFGTAR